MRTYKTIGLSCMFGCLLLTTAFFVQNFNFNSNQFSTSAPFLSIKSGALFTNADEQITTGQFYTVLYPNGTAAFVVSGSGTLQMLDALGNAYLQYVAGSNSLAINTNVLITGGLTVNSTNPNTTFSGSVIATNGFQMPSNAIPALVLTAGRAYFTNMTSSFVLSSFAGVPSDEVWSIYLLATNGSGGNLTVTGPNGAIASGQGKPPVFTVTNGNWAEFQFNGFGQVLTNMNWTPHY